MGRDTERGRNVDGAKYRDRGQERAEKKGERKGVIGRTGRREEGGDDGGGWEGRLIWVQGGGEEVVAGRGWSCPAGP